MPLDRFHLFHALPPEIQDGVWELCLPRRLISPYYSPVLQEMLGTLPGTRHKTYLPVRALIPFRPPLISRVCRRARATALRCGQYTPVRVEESDGSKSDGWIWLQKKSDWVYFTYHTMMEGLDESGAGPQVFELARGVGVPLLIDSTIQGDHVNTLHDSEDFHDSFHDERDNETIGSRLYKSFLSGREHFYYSMAKVILVVREEDRKHVINTGLFGLLGEDMAIIPTADKEMLQQYNSLYSMYDAKEALYDDCPARVKLGIDSMIRGEDQRTHEPRTLIRGLLERICEERGEFDISAEDMVNEDGSLKPEHPVVEKLGISMPICEKVVVFELRRLDTLLEDSLDWLSCDSTDNTDSTDTTDTADMDSDEF